jgi:hypothetical protein
MGKKTPLQRNALSRFGALSNFKLMESENINDIFY